MQYRILRESEYEKNKYILPNPGRRFWIESESELGLKRCGFVNDEGVLDKKGAYCSDTSPKESNTILGPALYNKLSKMHFFTIFLAHFKNKL